MRLSVATCNQFTAIFACTALPPAALSACGRLQLLSTLFHRDSFLAALSSTVSPWDFLPVAVVLLPDYCVLFARASLPGAFFSDISDSFLAAALLTLDVRWRKAT